MPYNIIFGKEALEDICAIPKKNAVQIAKAIEQRLSVDPFGLGKPLQYKLKGYKRLRVGDWRVVYQVHGQNVNVHRIVLRRDAYKDN